MATIKDVAKYTGLSLATISKYLNGGSLRAENRRKIDEAVAALGYRVNRNARSLKTSRTMTVGVVIPTTSVPFFGNVLASLDEGLREAGYTSFVCCYGFDRELELEKLSTLLSNNVDGVVLVAQHLDGSDIDRLRETSGRNVPIVLVDRTVPNFACDSVVIDNLNATYSVTERFINAGHRRIGIIVGPLNVSTGYERMTGYRRALADYGLNGAGDGLVLVGHYDFESGYRLFNALMDSDEPPTALCVTNYDMTMGAVTAAHERGVVLGRDLGFVGFDAVDLCRIVSPPLSIVEQPTELMGRRTSELLLKRLSGDMTDFPQVIRLKAHLHRRD